MQPLLPVAGAGLLITFLSLVNKRLVSTPVHAVTILQPLDGPEEQRVLNGSGIDQIGQDEETLEMDRNQFKDVVVV